MEHLQEIIHNQQFQLEQLEMKDKFKMLQQVELLKIQQMQSMVHNYLQWQMNLGKRGKVMLEKLEVGN